MGHCPQSNHHRSYRHSGSFRSGRLQIAMRTITLLIIHCSATPQGVALGFEDCRRDHIHHRGFRDIGYHFYLTRNGEIHRGRPLEKIGAHCLNHNRHSIGICYEGGLDAASFPADTRTFGGFLDGHTYFNCVHYLILLLKYLFCNCIIPIILILQSRVNPFCNCLGIFLIFIPFQGCNLRFDVL